MLPKITIAVVAILTLTSNAKAGFMYASWEDSAQGFSQAVELDPHSHESKTPYKSFENKAMNGAAVSFSAVSVNLLAISSTPNFLVGDVLSVSVCFTYDLVPGGPVLDGILRPS